MIYQVQMQFIPGNDTIWVLKLEPNDPTWEYETYEEAVDKANELDAADTSGRKYRVVEN
jgi:hypothetical protein